MSDRDFILANYNSFLDNVILNKDPEFWSGHFTGDDDDAGYLMDSLTNDVRAWRRRMENLAEREAACEAREARLVQRFAAERNGCTTCGAPGHDAAGCMHDGPDFFDGTKADGFITDPADSERWYDAIDRDEQYQQEME